MNLRLLTKKKKRVIILFLKSLNHLKKLFSLLEFYFNIKKLANKIAPPKQIFQLWPNLLAIFVTLAVVEVVVVVLVVPVTSALHVRVSTNSFAFNWGWSLVVDFF